MSEFNISIEAGKTKVLHTAGKYCDRDIVVTAEGGGGSSADLEALGVLCDWMITTNSDSEPTLTVINRHPSYYLRCDVYYSIEDEDIEMIVEPESSYSVFLGGRFTMESELYVGNVRWTANA